MNTPKVVKLDASEGTGIGMGTVGVAVEDGALVVAVELPCGDTITLSDVHARAMAKALVAAADHIAKGRS